MKKTHQLMGIVAACLVVASTAFAQVPEMIHFQGRIKSGGSNFDGTGYFKFALVNEMTVPPYDSLTRWSNDGTSTKGGEPSVSVEIPVADGLYSVRLGDTNMGMEPVEADIFRVANVSLRIWFSEDAAEPFQLLSPDIQVVSVGYALMAANIAPQTVTESKIAADAITSSKIKDGEVTSEKLAANSVTSRELADDISLGSATEAGQLSVYPGTSVPGAAAGASILLDGTGGLIESQEGFQVGLLGQSALLSEYLNGGRLTLYQANDSTGVSLLGDQTGGNSGGRITVSQGDGDVGVYITGDQAGAGYLSVRDVGGASVIKLDGSGSGGGGDASLYNDTGVRTIVMNGAESSGQGGQILLYNGSDKKTIEIDGDDPDSGGWIGLYDKTSTKRIELDANATGGACVTTEVLKITGGADFCEQFEITPTASTARPGMVLCVDPQHAGALRVSDRAYDPTVAGIVSGAGGINPGMLVGQQGTLADGRYPVALTGRVYCLADASGGAIEPGDLLTTSNLRGHAMKVTDCARAPGTIIGKAMSSLNRGQGLVLVLVSLQ